ncbi:hypothetical protein [Moorena sp. SIO4G3]|uniref:hypothetical protein n=1 Tax=Moorena sp. SIO4G3 TaxID=2607821 RepID=UPI00142B0F90|nr:hypothetical protein [Moorena sp. SIO4G3]NEO79333.1 hypothetical protein [Moorena sp. SIO4G3]
MTLVPPKVGGLGGQNSVSKNLGDILLPLFPSWQGLGVGFCSLLPAPKSLKTQNFVPN